MSPSGARALVVAKAPVPGRVKTRLGGTVGMERAARVAAAALVDTLTACTGAFGADRCHLALAGDLDDAVDGDALRHHLAGWSVTAQRGDDFATRLVNAHRDLGEGPVVQVGMDTPQASAVLLLEVADGLGGHDAVLGPAADGGWWVLALRDPALAVVLAGVPMSRPDTHDRTRAALVTAGLSVASGPVLRDVDVEADGDAVAAGAPGTRFARVWAAR